MSTLPHDPAFPLVTQDAEGALTTPTDESHHGLTKRERIAMAAMQGFTASGRFLLSDDGEHIIAQRSVALADRLIAELTRTEK